VQPADERHDARDEQRELGHADHHLARVVGLQLRVRDRLARGQAVEQPDLEQRGPDGDHVEHEQEAEDGGGRGGAAGERLVAGRDRGDFGPGPQHVARGVEAGRELRLRRFRRMLNGAHRSASVPRTCG
jgi:hypothetical protein